MFRGNRLDHSFYAKKAGGSALSTASPQALWQVVCGIGGPERYYTLNFLWWLRELIDWLFGGPGFTRGRRDSEHLRLGDTMLDERSLVHKVGIDVTTLWRERGAFDRDNSPTSTSVLR